MGYIQSTLPKYLARLGADVHLVTMDLPPSYYLEDFQRTYGEFLASEALQPGSVTKIDGYTHHVLGHRKRLGYMRMAGLRAKLADLKPQVVQTFVAVGWIPLDAAWMKTLFGYKLFTGNHTTISVFPLAARKAGTWDKERLRCLLTRGLQGRFTSWCTKVCYSATVDCETVATGFFGVQSRKSRVMPLGMDAELFHPIQDQQDGRDRECLRLKLGFSADQLVCVYSGRFTPEKNPELLARAIERLRNGGLPIAGLFIGDGPQKEGIQACAGSVAIPFVPFTELGRYFRASDLGAWPRQESMSMLDAAGCGIPIVVNDQLKARERVDGNGLTYRLDDLDDLQRAIATLADPALRRRLGREGARKMREEYSWQAIAERRFADYKACCSA